MSDALTRGLDAPLRFAEEEQVEDGDVGDNGALLTELVAITTDEAATTTAAAAHVAAQTVVTRDENDDDDDGDDDDDNDDNDDGREKPSADIQSPATLISSSN